jgi:hypothetical protein
MARRERKSAPDFAFDLLADWREVVTVDNPPAVAEGWILHGTVRVRGVAYALAWRGGTVDACTWWGAIQALTAIERSRISLAVEFKSAPGWETVPKNAPPPGPFTPTWT